MQFIDGYAKGLTGAEAEWANWKYWGHCILSPDIMNEVKKIYFNTLVTKYISIILPTGVSFTLIQLVKLLIAWIGPLTLILI